MNNSLLFQQCNELDILEKHYVQIYAGNLYKPLNLFLLNMDKLQTYRHIYPQEFAQNLYYLITNRPDLYVNGTITHDEENRIVKLIRSKSNDIEWFRHIMFRFTIILYGIILKCPRQQQEVEVYRGVFSHYLKEDRVNGYFLNTFTSTSSDKQMARSFSLNNNKDAIIYHFILMPGVSCIYIGRNESEILLNPYQLYYLIKKEDNHYYYAIQPVSIIPPYNENKFSEFKKDITLRTVAMEGGRIGNRELIHTATITNYRNTRCSKNTRKNRNTKKNNRKKLSEIDHFRARMNMPIGTSSFSIPLTPEMIANRERLAKEYTSYSR